MNKRKSAVTLRFDGKEFNWEVGEYLLKKLESQMIVKEVFALHGMFTNSQNGCIFVTF